MVVQERLDHLGQGKSWNVFLVMNVGQASLQMHWEGKRDEGHEVAEANWMVLALDLFVSLCLKVVMAMFVI